MEVNALPRKFKLQFRTSNLLLDDPNPDLNKDEVKDLFAAQYAELATATMSGPVIENDAMVYMLSAKTAGVKG